MVDIEKYDKNEEKNEHHIYFWESSSTGKSLSEALIFAEHRENMLCTEIVLNVKNNLIVHNMFSPWELGIFMYWTCNSMNNLCSFENDFRPMHVWPQHMKIFR